MGCGRERKFLTITQIDTVLEGDAPPVLCRVLHVGCGHAKLPEWLKGRHGEIKISETRLDINPDVNPDIVGSMTDLGNIGPFDFVYSSHCLEHLYLHDVLVALGEAKRVLANGGTLFVMVPDLEDVRPTTEILYEAEVGPIAGIDLIYGHRDSIRFNSGMAHKTGFVQSTLKEAIEHAGFVGVNVTRDNLYNLWAVGKKP